jgi:hypothetical protein
MITTPTAPVQHSQAWVGFTYASFLASLALIGGGILFMPLDVWIKGYFLMAVAMLVQSSITVTKTVRDVHEGTRLHNKLEDAKTERLLMDIEKKR